MQCVFGQYGLGSFDFRKQFIKILLNFIFSGHDVSYKKVKDRVPKKINIMIEKYETM